MSEERQVLDVPGVGELRVRVGTSTSELAGGVAFWYKKHQTAWRDGFATASIFWGVLGASAVAVFHYLL